MAPYHRARYADAKGFSKLIDDIEWTLIKMPLPKLQRVDGSVRDFIYEIAWDDSIKKSDVSKFRKGDSSAQFDGAISFKKNVGDYFISLNTLLRPLIQRQWAAQVARLNQLQEARLQQFLFGASRQSTAILRDDLIDLQEGRCFYCEEKFGHADNKMPEVDHFIPWARYPNDALANFVVADKKCNNHKKDFLASGQHLNKWWKRISDTDDSSFKDLNHIAEQRSWETGFEITQSVASAIYLRLHDGVDLWQRGREFVPADLKTIKRIIRI